MPASSQASSELSTASLMVVRSAFEGLSKPSRWRFLTKNSETEISRCFCASDSAVARRVASFAGGRAGERRGSRGGARCRSAGRTRACRARASPWRAGPAPLPRTGRAGDAPPCAPAGRRLSSGVTAWPIEPPENRAVYHRWAHGARRRTNARSSSPPCSPPRPRPSIPLLALLWGLALGTLCPRGQRAEAPVAELPAPGAEAVEAAVTATMTRVGIPGASVAIAGGGRLRFAQGFGTADLENGVPATASTMYRLASVSKPITAAAVLEARRGGPPRPRRAHPALRARVSREGLAGHRAPAPRPPGRRAPLSRRRAHEHRRPTRASRAASPSSRTTPWWSSPAPGTSTPPTATTCWAPPSKAPPRVPTSTT